MSQEIELKDQLAESEKLTKAAKELVEVKRFDSSVSDDEFLKVVYAYLDLKEQTGHVKAALIRLEDNEREVGSADDDRMRESESKLERLLSEIPGPEAEEGATG
ncbi:MAG TPA: hypothetical protein VGS11_10870 [Candidatus Bathyarchaeia archaeon]|nr:hypothetical protein [Candidatus Bathyarchaeia archaeon]